MIEEGRKIELLGKAHAVVLPSSFCVREEISLAFYAASKRARSPVQLRRAAAAALGLCTRIGRHSGASYEESGCDPLVYGGKVYDWLVAEGATATDILTVGRQVVDAVNEALYPAPSEVAAKQDFSVAGA
jgi:hypothetical protein